MSRLPPGARAARAPPATPATAPPARTSTSALWTTAAATPTPSPSRLLRLFLSAPTSQGATPAAHAHPGTRGAAR
eukprot:CAMPEP_0118931278 /NCGR_PEP_ID=MMETSP1169-20130426/7676_1 /TAXON_ID=36882 /ORGANISM="Pyramimonas obovata, Strain CCMP722" /LENGTH=74 /DNA_ID=CAMNT_0006873757 /DNA_START=17 /DNA_END=238 /DNA_ORIENTATION=-